jgi:hypothetical protein
MYDASVPVFVRGLKVFSHLLKKGAAFAEERGLDPAELVHGRLAPDMLTLAGQVQRASDTSKFAIKRLTDADAPSFEDTEASFEELQDRIANTIAYLQATDPASLTGTETKPIEFKVGGFTPSFTGTSYLLEFALPNFFFHVTTAYDILRHTGVPVGKVDYLGGHRQEA